MPDRGCPGWEELADWWAGDLDAAGAAEVEEHLIGCEPCSRRAELLSALVEGLAAVARRGEPSGVAGPGHLRRLERDGLRVHRYRLEPGQVVPCSVWPEDQLMATLLATGEMAPGEAARLDLLVQLGGGPAVRLEDVPVDRTAGTVTWLSAAARERRLPRTLVSFRLVRVADGVDTPVGEYTLSHRPWEGPHSPR